MAFICFYKVSFENLSTWLIFISFLLHSEMVKIRFRLTGFSQFGGIEQNPTEVLINKLREDLDRYECFTVEESNPLDKRDVCPTIATLRPQFPKNVTFDVPRTLEVSTQAVRSYLQDISSQNPLTEDECIVR